MTVVRPSGDGRTVGGSQPSGRKVGWTLPNASISSRAPTVPYVAGSKEAAWISICAEASGTVKTDWSSTTAVAETALPLTEIVNSHWVVASPRMRPAEDELTHGVSSRGPSGGPGRSFRAVEPERA
ncbi:hypothetical protein GCM10017687_77180 [Streptomyces echinatus]